MELFQDLTVKLNPNYPGFQRTLVELVEKSGDWKIRKDLQEAFVQRGLLKDRTVICIETPILSYQGKELQGVIWAYDFGTLLKTFNIIPSNSNKLSKDEYNFLLNEFVNTFIYKTAADYRAEVLITKPIMELMDYVDQDIYDALVVFSEMANKSTGHSHPLDNKRWCDFILISASKKKRLSVNYLEGWLMDHGWSSDMANELGLDYEYGLTLLDYEHHRR